MQESDTSCWFACLFVLSKYSASYSFSSVLGQIAAGQRETGEQKEPCGNRIIYELFHALPSQRHSCYQHKEGGS